MADLSKLSDADLEKIANNDFTGLSDEALKVLAGEPEGRSVLSTVGKVADYIPGLTRTAVADIAGELAGKPDIATLEDYKKAAKWSTDATPSEEFLARSGMKPGIGRKAAGFVSDVGLDVGLVLPYLSPIEVGLKGAGLAAKGLQQGPKLMQMLGKTLGKGAEVGKKPSVLLPEASTVGQSVSGTPKDAIQTLYKNPEAVEELAQAAPEVRLEKAAEIKNALKEELFKRKQKLGLEMDAAAKEATDLVDISPIKERMERQIAELKLNPDLANQPAMQQRIADLEALSAQYLDNVPNNVKPSTALTLQQQFKDLADLSKLDNAGVSARNAGKSSMTKQDENLFLDAYRLANEGLEKATAGKSGQIKSQFKEVFDIERNLKAGFGTEQSTLNTLTKTGTKGKTAMTKSINKLSPDLAKEAEVLRSASIFSDRALTPVSGAGSTSTSRTMLAKGLGAAGGSVFGGPTGAAIGAITGDFLASPEMVYQTTKTAGKTAQLIPESVKKGFNRLNEKAQQRLLWVDLMNKMGTNDQGGEQ